MRKSAGLLATTLFVVGLLCAPALAQDDDDDDDKKGGIWIPILVFAAGADSKSSPQNLRTDLGRGGPRMVGPNARPWLVRVNATPRMRRVYAMPQQGRAYPMPRTGHMHATPRMVRMR
jgi:hypothetical protein